MAENENNDELILEFYGIDPVILKAAHVSITKSGKASRYLPIKGYVTKQIDGHSAAEVERLFDLIELVQINCTASVAQRIALMSALEEKIQASLLGAADALE